MRPFSSRCSHFICFSRWLSISFRCWCRASSSLDAHWDYGTVLPTATFSFRIISFCRYRRHYAGLTFSAADRKHFLRHDISFSSGNIISFHFFDEFSFLFIISISDYGGETFSFFGIDAEDFRLIISLTAYFTHFLRFRRWVAGCRTFFACAFDAITPIVKYADVMRLMKLRYKHDRATPFSASQMKMPMW